MIILKELVPYTLSKLMELTEVDIKKLNKIIQILEEKKIIKINKKEEIQFHYVGIAIVKDIPIFVLPKYTMCESKKEKISELKNIVKLLNQLAREKLDKNDIDDVELEKDMLEQNIIPLVSYLLDDYIENGIYQNEINTTEYNGNGDIDWGSTIDKIDPLIINGQFLYNDLITYKSEVDNNKFASLLHGRVINECIEFLSKTGLNEFLNYDVNVIESTISDLNDTDKIENEINKELTVQFNDRKRRVLFAIKSYLDKKSGLSDNKLLLYGTRNFKWIWEVICGYVFDNDFIKNGAKSKYEIFGIEAPKWYIGNKSGVKPDERNEIDMKKNRLTPDILKSTFVDKNKYLLILDAKYYNIKVHGKKIEDNPGIEDITKQYLYHVSLRKYIEENKIDRVINAFLFPTSTESHFEGEVVLDFMKSYSNTDIKLINLNVNEIINTYCNNRKINLENFIYILENNKGATY